MSEKNSQLFKGFVVILLLMNTFFIGSMWCSMQSCGEKICPLSGSKKDGKICPLTGKTLDAKGSASEVKGSVSNQ